MPHLHDKIDFTSSVYIVCGDKVLLRFHEKHKCWLAPGGHIELDQDPVETAHKEIKEEVGLEIEIIADPVKEFPLDDNNADNGTDLPLPMFINRHRINDTHEHIDFLYAAKSKTMDINPEEGEESNPDSFRWLTAAEVESMPDISARVKYHALEALKKVQNQ